MFRIKRGGLEYCSAALKTGLLTSNARGGRVGVVLVDDEAALVIEQTVKNVRRLIGRRGNDLGMKRCKLIG
jgi:hypothetical protein